MSLSQICESNLIRVLYESATKEPAWEAFFQELLTVLNLRSCNLLTTNMRSGEVCSHHQIGVGIERKYMNDYVEYYRDRDPIVTEAFCKPFGTVLTLGTLPESKRSQVLQSDYYQNWCVPQGIFDGACAQVLAQGDWRTLIVLERSERQGRFSSKNIALIQQLLPHLREALKLHLRFNDLKNESSGIEALLALFPCGAAIADSNGIVSNINHRALEVLKRHAGLSIVQQRLAFEDTHLAKRVGLSIVHSLNTTIHVNRGEKIGGRAAHVYRVGDESSPLLVLILPLSVFGDQSKPLEKKVLIALYESQQSLKPHIETVATLYNLTHSEADLVASLITGESLEDIALRCCKSKETLRGYLKNIFRKLNVNRQAELVSKILTGPAMLSAAARPYLF